MPRQRLHQKEAVGKLADRVQMYADSVGGNDGKNGRPRQTGSAVKSRLKWSRVAKANPVSEEFECSDLEDWSTDSGMPSSGAAYAKEWAMLWDAKKEQEIDRLLDAIEKMRPAGAVRADMDKAWEVFASVQCK